MHLHNRATESQIKLMNETRFSDLPKVGGCMTGTLEKLAEAGKKGVDFSPAERIKLASAHLYNFIGAAEEAGLRVKVASMESGIDQDFIKKVAHKYVREQLISNTKTEEA